MTGGLFDPPVDLDRFFSNASFIYQSRTLLTV
jgi:hypothetical protein